MQKSLLSRCRLESGDHGLKGFIGGDRGCNPMVFAQRLTGLIDSLGRYSAAPEHGKAGQAALAVRRQPVVRNIAPVCVVQGDQHAIAFNALRGDDPPHCNVVFHYPARPEAPANKYQPKLSLGRKNPPPAGTIRFPVRPAATITESV